MRQSWFSGDNKLRRKNAKCHNHTWWCSWMHLPIIVGGSSFDISLWHTLTTLLQLHLAVIVPEYIIHGRSDIGAKGDAKSEMFPFLSMLVKWLTATNLIHLREEKHGKPSLSGELTIHYHHSITPRGKFEVPMRGFATFGSCWRSSNYFWLWNQWLEVSKYALDMITHHV